jgi:mannose-6-phosphate isomerase-like protein (cupin superfamily)
MKQVQVNFDSNFSVLAGNGRGQAAVMVLQPGETTGGPDNRHEQSDQWMLVISGEAQAVVEGQEVELRPGTLLLIEPGEGHEIRVTGDKALKTINFYTPPEY